jgi:hypothetical protein
VVNSAQPPFCAKESQKGNATPQNKFVTLADPKSLSTSSFTVFIQREESVLVFVCFGSFLFVLARLLVTKVAPQSKSQARGGTKNTLSFAFAGVSLSLFIKISNIVQNT